jgi:protein-tyrosine phosphatase
MHDQQLPTRLRPTHRPDKRQTCADVKATCRKPATLAGADRLVAHSRHRREPDESLMIDLHCHILPGIDDGAADLEESLAMARMAVADGITVTACTSHIFPGMYNNNGDGIRLAMATLQAELDRQAIPLRLVEGADVQLDLGILEGLRSGAIPSLNGSRYFLFEPPHLIAPPRIEDANRSYVAAGYVPVITHPERLKWLDGDGYGRVCKMVDDGAWVQITAGALTGMFGRRPKEWSQRMLAEGRVHLIASDAHNMRRRVPVLSEAREAAAAIVGEVEAWRLVRDRPQAILDNLAPDALPPPPGGTLPETEPEARSHAAAPAPAATAKKKLFGIF